MFFILRIVDQCDNKVGVTTEVFSSREKALTYLAAWCRAQWGEQFHSDELPDEERAAIDRFFEFWEDEMRWAITENLLDPEDA